MNVDERVSKVERRVSTVEEAIQLLSHLVASHDDRLFDSLKKDEDLNEKITMLIDAQIRNEDKIQDINSALDNVNSALDKLTDLVKVAHSRLNQLEK